MKTLLIIDSCETVDFDKDGMYYVNKNKDKCYIAPTAATTFIHRGTHNVMALQGEIAELKKQIRKLNSKGD